jgi:H+-transporting ATPase
MQWNIKALFLVSSVMGAVSFVSSLILLYAALDSCDAKLKPAGIFGGFNLPCMAVEPDGFGKIIMMVYLKVAVSDFLTLFSARTGPKWFWTTLPAPALAIAASISLAVSTIIACVMKPTKLDGRELAGLNTHGYQLFALWVWIYCIIVFVIQDALKVRTQNLCCRTSCFCA